MVTGLQQWLDRVARKERARPSLQESLLGRRFAAYGWYRLRFLALTRPLGLAVHLLELLFLTRVFTQQILGASLAVSNTAAIAGAFWWGGLEVLRGHVREHPQAPMRSVAIERWLTRATAVALGLVSATLMVLLWRRPIPQWGLLEGYVVVVVGRLAIDLVVRTLYAGVYATRRVYRPLPAMLFSEVGGFLVLVILWQVLGAWSFPVALAVMVLYSRAILVLYTLRAYEALRVPRPRWRGIRELALHPRPGDVAQFFGAGIGNATTRLGSILVLLLLVPGRGQASTAVLAVHVLAPVLATAAGWPHLFYPDFKRLADPLVTHLRRRLEIGLRKLATVMGLVTWAIGGAILPVVVDQLSWVYALAIGPWLLVQSHLARLQAQAFAREHYRRLGLGFMGVVTGCALAVATVPDLEDIAVPLTIAAILTAGIALLLLGRSPGPDWNVRGECRGRPVWEQSLCHVHEPVRVGQIQLEDDRLQVRRTIARWLTHRLQDRGAVLDQGDSMLWFETRTETEPPVGKTELITATAGLASEVHSSEFLAIGEHALQAIHRLGWLADNPAEPARQSPPRHQDDLRQSSGTALLASLTAEQRSEIWRAALVRARGGRPRPVAGLRVYVRISEGMLERISLHPTRKPGDAAQCSDGASSAQSSNSAAPSRGPSGTSTTRPSTTKAGSLRTPSS